MRQVRKTGGSSWALLTFLLVFTAVAQGHAEQAASPRASVFLEVEGTCPSAAAVEKELRPLLSRWSVTKDRPQAAEVARVSDEGEGLEIAVVGDQRDVADSGRNCQERARVAAVVIALRLEPAGSDGGSRPLSEEPPAPESSPPSANASSRSSELELAAGILAEKSIDRALGLGAGPQIALALSWGIGVLYASGGVQSVASFDAAGVPLSFTRFPLDVGGGLSMRAGSWRLQSLALLALDNFRVSAGGLDDARVSGRGEVGPRLAFRIARHSGRLRPFGMIRAAWFPQSYLIEAAPAGEIARTPQWWIGASLGFGLPLTRW